MQLKHTDIWRAIDTLAKQNGLSASGLARKAGLSPTIFNPSKRMTAKRKRWPSTESIARILMATETELESFVALATLDANATRTHLPMPGLAQAGGEDVFDEDGHPSKRGWDEVQFPGLSDAHAFMLQINGKTLEPVLRGGDRIIVSPSEKVRRGDRVVIRSKKGELMVGQLGRESGRNVELLPLHAAQPVLEFSLCDIAWIYRIVWVGLA